MITTNFLVVGMSCRHCEDVVRAEINRIAGLERVSVDASTGELTVESDGPIDEALVLAAVDQAGYQARRVL